MQQLFAAFAARQDVADSFAHASQPGRPRFIFRAELLLQFLADILRKGWTIASGGDGDLEFAAADHGGRVEIAVAGIVHGVAQSAGLARLFINSAVDLFRVGCGDDKEISFCHAWTIFKREVLETALMRPQPDAWRNLRREHGDVCGGAEHSFDLLLRDQAASDDEDFVAFEFEENWIE